MHTHSVKIENDMHKRNLKEKKNLESLSPVFGVEVDLPMWTTANALIARNCFLTT